MSLPGFVRIRVDKNPVRQRLPSEKSAFMASGTECSVKSEAEFNLCQTVRHGISPGQAGQVGRRLGRDKKQIPLPLCGIGMTNVGQRAESLVFGGEKR
jgi:hypothetical protein